MVNLSKHNPSAKTETNLQEKSKEPYDKQTRSVFITINHPVEHGLPHETIIEIMQSKFKHVQYWCMCDEIGTQGTYHTHIFILLERNHKKRWSSIRKAFPFSHLDIDVKGSPQECRAYIRKEGDKYIDKKETNLPDTFYEEGQLPKYQITGDRTETLLQIQEMIDSGMKPEQIMENIIYRQYETIIRKAFFAKRLQETPPLREIRIIWHIGASGSGKSYTYTKLCEEYGEEDVYFGSDYSNNCTALFDNYQAEKIIFLDEIKTDSFKYGFLLQIFQGYKAQIHARYNNVYSLWTEIHATSIFTPDEIYDEMVSLANRTIDSKTQLLRWITDYCYHWKNDSGYHTFQIPASEYVSYQNLKERAEGSSDFKDIDESKNPFE